MESTNVKPSTVQTTTPAVGGSKDGLGAADHDEPYRFGYRPSARWTCPFSAETYCPAADPAWARAGWRVRGRHASVAL